MKRLTIYVLLIAPYVFVSGGAQTDVSSFSFLFTISAFGLVCGLNMVNALTTPRRGARAKTYLFWCMVLKLCMIPLYGICGHLIMQSEVVVQSVSIIMFSLLGGLILILTTSSYGWRGLWVAQQQGLVSRRFAFSHAIIQMFYIVDVLSAVYCYVHIRHLEAEQNALS